MRTSDGDEGRHCGTHGVPIATVTASHLVVCVPRVAVVSAPCVTCYLLVQRRVFVLEASAVEHVVPGDVTSQHVNSTHNTEQQRKQTTATTPSIRAARCAVHALRLLDHRGLQAVGSGHPDGLRDLLRAPL